MSSAFYGRPKARGTATVRSRSLHRKAQIVQYSEQGLTLAQAAERAGITEHGVRSTLRRNFNSTHWPIPGREPDA